MRLNELDLLRFIAALAVVLFHYVARYTVDFPIGSNILRHIGMVTQFGFLGVHLFFMISGFVILVSAENRSNFEFCIVRFVRLFPTYWLSVTLTSLTIYLAIPSHNLELSTYLINLTMLQSYVGVSNIDGIYWTLAKELQFYACIFILISCKLISKIDYWLTGWLLLTVIYILIGQPFFMGWFISPEFSSLFIAGVYFYLIRKNSMKMHYLLGLTISLVLSMYQAYISSPSFLKTFTSMEQIISSIIILFFYLIFYLVITDKWKLTKNKNFLFFGALTYPLYLIHNTIGKLIIDNIQPYFGIEISILLVTFVMLILAYSIYFYFEKNIVTKLKHRLLQILN